MTEAKTYQRIRQRLTFVNLALTPLLLWLVLVTGISVAIRDQASAWTSQPYAALAIYFALFSLLMLVFDLPLAFYSGFKLEHRFKLSNQTFTAWVTDLTKKSLLSFVFSLLLIEALYFLIWHFSKSWWVLAWAAFTLVSYGMGKLFPVFIVPLFYKYGKVEDEGLKARIFALAERYQLPVQNVFSINLSKTTKKANAAFMGFGKTKRVVLSDTLIDNFTADEIETVVAHELGHYKHKDVWKSLGFGVVTSFAAFALAFHYMEPTAAHFGLNGASDIAALPLLFLIFYAFSLVLMPIQNGFSRWIERAADRFALQAFPQPSVFISCMEKLAKVNLADPEPHPFIEWLLHDHPAIGKRIAMAKKIQVTGGK